MAVRDFWSTSSNSLPLSFDAGARYSEDDPPPWPYQSVLVVVQFWFTLLGWAILVGIFVSDIVSLPLPPAGWEQRDRGKGKGRG